ncbi:RHS repeat domain-containing protein [Leucothrix arctica]|uniref:RHS repeat protein n=1 Tax=Leucothrix arctica TaxID=1481894 RepID=A0A317C9L8_9GAMM|nr:RHS repeat domain-containing protein [Leucothrix arctica]PWQ95057.1 hypothetical protein DKT75_13635 [Leucothrix arctica]
MKVGNFSLTFEDVNIPLAGIPIVVSRTYDSRQKDQNLDFGYGWSVDYQNVRVHESRPVGRSWALNRYSAGFFDNWCVEPNGDPTVSVTLPNGRVEKFVAKASPQCQQITPAIDVAIVFEPVGNTTATLTQSDYSTVRIVNGNLVDLLGDPGLDVDPQNYQLTTADGYIYDLEQGFNIRKVTEPNGQTLTFSSEGVFHSTGASVSFERDVNGNISAITLPDETQITYEHDTNGNLIAHKDQLDNAATFAYNNQHGLVDIFDPRGVRVTQNEYDEAGRLIAQIDADGNRIEFTHDIGSNLEVVKNRRGFTQVFSYDGAGNVLAETNGAGETTTRTYDNNSTNCHVPMRWGIRKRGLMTRDVTS